MTIDDRMKLYEGVEADRSLIPLLPVIGRLDGRAFHTFTRGLKRPYDERMSRMMVDVTKFLVQETDARIGYTQSDEISLIWWSQDFESQIFFNGRIFKMISMLSAMASVKFNELCKVAIPEKADQTALFDARVWNVPNITEATNYLVWREQDASKNSVSMAARHYYSHNDLMNKNGSEMQEMLFAKGVNWNDYPAFFKRGTYIKRVRIVRPFTPDEIDKLPEKHTARINPMLMVSRSEIAELDIAAPLSKIETREDVLFGS